MPIYIPVLLYYDKVNKSHQYNDDRLSAVSPVFFFFFSLSAMFKASLFIAVFAIIALAQKEPPRNRWLVIRSELISLLSQV